MARKTDDVHIRKRLTTYAGKNVKRITRTTILPLNTIDSNEKNTVLLYASVDKKITFVLYAK